MKKPISRNEDRPVFVFDILSIRLRPHHIHYEGYNKDNKQNVKEDFGNTGKSAGDAPEPQYGEN